MHTFTSVHTRHCKLYALCASHYAFLHAYTHNSTYRITSNLTDVSNNPNIFANYYTVHSKFKDSLW